MGGVVKTVTSAVDNTFGTNIGGENANDKAYKEQRRAADRANDTQRYMYDQNREDMAYMRDAGERAVGELETGNFARDIQMDPGYQFRMDEANKALERSAAARGGLNSGRAMKELSRFNQDYASNEYQNAYNREFTRLSSLAGIGNAGVSGTVQAGQNMASNVSQNQIGVGNANAARYQANAAGQANLIGTGLGLAFCDIRVKKNIREVKESDLQELRDAIKPYHFEYITGEMGEGEWVGIMAQDIEKTKLGKACVLHNSFGQKLVDQKKLLALLISSFGKGAA